jgi:DNA-binding NtrC family response regulator
MNLASPRSVLVVDDDPEAVRSVARLLESNGLIARTATCAEEALALLDENADSVGVVVSDYQMPGLDGVQLLKRLRIRWPRIRRILLTGKADLDAASRAVNDGRIARLVLKPFEPHVLSRAVVQCLHELDDS